MPYCIVPGCDNYRKMKKEGKNASYHRLPADTERSREWLRVIKNPKFHENIPASDLASLRVCSSHFTEDDYNRDMKAVFFGGPTKRSLKSCAVPTLFGGEVSCGREEPHEKRGKATTEPPPVKLETCSSERPDPPDRNSHCDPPSTTNPAESRDDCHEPKAVVHQSCVFELFRTCQQCGSPVISTQVSYAGAQMKVEWECKRGHSDTWKSYTDVKGRTQEYCIIKIE